MPKTTQRKKVSELFSGIDTLIETAVTQEEIEDVLKIFADMFKKASEQFAEKMVENKDEMGAQMQKNREEMETISKKFQEIVDETRELGTTSLADSIDQIRKELKDVEDSIPNQFDGSFLEDQLDELGNTVNQIIDLQTAENIRNALETLNGDERLKASAIDGLEELIKDYVSTKKTVAKLQGAASTPSPMHWPLHERFTMDGAATTVTLANGVSAQGNAIIVRYQGQTLDMDTDYTVDGNKVTFTTAPEIATVISITYWP